MKRGLFNGTLILLSVGISAQEKPIERDTFVISGAEIVNENHSLTSGKLVFVKDGKIEKISDSGADTTGYKQITATGKRLYPGFIESALSKGVKAPPAPVETGKPNYQTNAPASLWIGNRKGINPDYKASANLDFSGDGGLLKAGFTTVNLFLSQGGFKGTGVALDNLGGDYKERVIKPETAQGLSFRIGSGAGYPSNILGQIALIRQVLADAQSVKEGSSFGIAETDKPFWMNALNALQPVLNGKQVVFFDASLDREIERSIRLVDEFKFKIAVVGGRDAYKMVDQIKASGGAVVLNLDFGSAPELTGSKDDPTPKEVRQERLDRWKLQAGSPKALVDAGVMFAASSGGNSSDFLRNLRQAVSNGVPQDVLMRSLTVVPAQLLEISDQVGSIAAGKRANFFLASGSIFDEGTRIESVWVDGRPVVTPEVKK